MPRDLEGPFEYHYRLNETFPLMKTCFFAPPLVILFFLGYHESSFFHIVFVAYLLFWGSALAFNLYGEYQKRIINRGEHAILKITGFWHRTYNSESKNYDYFLKPNNSEVDLQITCYEDVKNAFENEGIITGYFAQVGNAQLLFIGSEDPDDINYK